MSNAPPTAIEWLKEREFQGYMVADVSDGSPAEIGGLRPNDIIERINGKSVEGDAKGLTMAVSAGKEMLLTVKRGGRRLDLSLRPRIDEETGTYRCGVFYETKTFVETRDAKGRERLLERRRGEYHDAQGRPVCEYAIDMEREEVNYRNDREMHVGHPLVAIRLLSATGSIDLLKRFNTRNVPVLLSERGNVLGGIHDPLTDTIVINSIEVPSYAGLLLHELTHADQHMDKRWNPYLETYGLSHFTLDKEDLYHPDILGRLFYLKEKVPRILEGVGTDAIAAAAAEVERQLEPAPFERFKALKEELEGEIMWPFMKSAAELEAYLDSLVAERAERLAVNEDFAYSPTLPPDERAAFLRKAVELGLQFDPDLYRTIDDFKAILALVRYPRRAEKLDARVNSKTGERTFIAKAEGGGTIRWSVSLSKVEEAGLTERMESLEREVRQVLKSIEHAFCEAEKVELRPGLGVLDALSYPRWVVERDAERGSLTALRKVREETGIDLLQPLSELSEADRQVIAWSEDEEFLRTQPPEHLDAIKHRAKLIREIREGKPKKAVERVNAYMGMIGATLSTVRKMERVGIKRGF